MQTFTPVDTSLSISSRMDLEDSKMTIVVYNRKFNEGWKTSGILPHHWENILFLESNKLKNRKQKMKNGNRKESYKIIHWNLGAKRWNKKLTEIELLLSEQKPDLCFISEANMWEGLAPHETEIDGHFLVLPNTLITQHHARLVLIVRNGINVTKLNQFMDSNSATIWVQLGNTKKNSVRIGGIYREHTILGQTDKNMTQQELQRLQEERWKNITNHWAAAGSRQNCVVIGDLNLDMDRWSNPEQNHIKMVERTQEIIEVAGFRQLITGFTRCWQGQKDSVIDHIWVNCGQLIVNHFNHVRSDSDHNMIGCNLSTRNIPTGGQNILKRKWGNFNADRCREKFKQVDWQEVYKETDPNLANSKLEEIIRTVLDSEAPMAVIQVRNKYLKWITGPTKDKMKLRDSARETARNSQKIEDWTKYRILRNDCTKQQKRDKRHYLRDMYKRYETEDNSSALYGLTRQLLGWKTSGPPSRLVVKGKNLTKQVDIANAQAMYYKSKVENIKLNLPQVRTDPLEYLRKAFHKWTPVERIPTFKIKPVTVSEVLKMLSEHKKSQAFGDDCIDVGTLKLAKFSLAAPITWVINLSLGTNTFVNKWKVGRIIPLLKSKESDNTNPGHYRPVSQLSIISKLAERTVQRQLLKHLEDTGQLSGDHHAYRLRTSTTTALLHITDNIARGIDENKVVATISTDLTAAFDCVEHRLLLDKLKFYSIGCDALAWIESYLSLRSSYVAIGSGKSDYFSNTHGVPQGSCPGTFTLPSVYERVLNVYKK